MPSSEISIQEQDSWRNKRVAKEEEQQVSLNHLCDQGALEKDQEKEIYQDLLKESEKELTLITEKFL